MTADFQNIGVSEQSGRIHRLAEGCAQGGTFVEADVAAIGALHQDLDRHRDAMTQHLNPNDRKADLGGCALGKPFEFGVERIGQNCWCR